eukprot:8465357-Karenia_brevis.AAC.1
MQASLQGYNRNASCVHHQKRLQRRGAQRTNVSAQRCNEGSILRELFDELQIVISLLFKGCTILTLHIDLMSAIVLSDASIHVQDQPLKLVSYHPLQWLIAWACWFTPMVVWYAILNTE